MATNRPTGTVTFLFTDIEGSTQLWEDHPELMKHAFTRQEAILREATTRQDGYPYKMIGDAFQIAFSTAPQAMTAALEAQRGLQTEPWGEVELRVRMALHTGVTEERRDELGDDYVGPALNRLGRLIGVGYGGQVLLSQATADLVRDSLPPGVELKDLGERRLRDLTRAEHIYQLVAPDLPANFPPLKTLDVCLHNLPVQLTSFIGREKERVEVKRLLGVNRLVTLVGSGGSGKTRLALEVASDLSGEYPQGVWFADLSGLNDPAMVPQIVASMYGLQETAGQPLLSTVVSYLKSRQSLLVLDNCEHLLETCAQLADNLLRACPNLKILATSRAPLHISGEWTWMLNPLSLPNLDRSEEDSGLFGYEAIRLFTERAQAVQPSFRLNPDNVKAVARICVQLDGLPLAIELAAARVRMFTVEVIASHLSQTLELSTGVNRAAQTRQRTLRGAIEWSYQLLSSDEQILFRRLSVFAGSFTLEAAEIVTKSKFRDIKITSEKTTSLMVSQPPDFLNLLTQLIDQSLVLVEGERYRLLETIREYAHLQLHASAETEFYHQRHAAYFMTLAEQQDPEYALDRLEPHPDRLKEDLPNLRNALAFYRENGDIEAGLQMAGALWRFWRVGGFHAEGTRWLEGFLNSGKGSILGRARALIRAGCIVIHTGDYWRANRYFVEGLELANQVNHQWSIAFALCNMHDIYYAILYNQIPTDELFEKILARAQATNNLWLIAFALCHAIGFGTNQEDRVRDAKHLQESLAIARSLQDPWLIAYILLYYGVFQTSMGELDQARVYREECLTINRALGDCLSIAHVLLALADTAYQQGDYAAVYNYLEERLEMERCIENRYGIGRSLNTLGNVACQLGNYPCAREKYMESLALFQEVGSHWDIANQESSLGMLAIRRGQYSEANSWLKRGLRRYIEVKESREVTGSLLSFAHLALRVNQPLVAVRLFAYCAENGFPIAFNLLGTQAGWFQPVESRHALCEVEAALDPLEFSTNWQAGQLLSQPQAIVLALAIGD